MCGDEDAPGDNVEVVQIGRIAELRGSRSTAGSTIGAMTTYDELQDSSELAGAFPVIKETVNIVGDPAVRARGTLGGSLRALRPGGRLHGGHAGAGRVGKGYGVQR